MKSDIPHIFGELTVPPNDSWRMVLVDAIVCTAIFAIATGVADIAMNVVGAFVETRLAIVYLPVWSLIILIVAFYARKRQRVRFDIADLLWSIPFIFVLAATIDILGASSRWIFIVAYLTYFAVCYVRSVVVGRAPLHQDTDVHIL